jgi:predicted permease
MLSDLRYAVRSLLKSPGFTAVAVLSLALGIGATTTIFSMVNALLLRSLPVPNPQELRLINWHASNVVSGLGGDIHTDSPTQVSGQAVSLDVFRVLEKQGAEQADIFGRFYLFGGVTARGRHEAVRADGLRVSGNFFSGLRVKPELGRLLDPRDDRPGAQPVVVISHALWQTQFDLDPGAIGQLIRLNDKSFTVVGVLPPEFIGIDPGDAAEFCISLSADPLLMPDLSGQPQYNMWRVLPMARLRPGVDDAQLQATLSVAFASATQNLMSQTRIDLTDGSVGPRSDSVYYREPLLLLLGMVSLVLLVACANLAGLMLARGAVRKHEFAVRAALGAGRWRLIRQTLIESTLLAFVGGGLGVLLANWGGAIGLAMISLNRARDSVQYDTTLDHRVLTFALLLTLLASVASGLLPALRAASVDPQAGLKDKTALGSSLLRGGRALVAVQVAMSLLLVAGGGLFVRTMVNLVQVNPGFGIDHLLLFRLTPANAGYQEPARTAFFDRALKSLDGIPGVVGVGLAEMPLLGGGYRTFGIAVDGHNSEPVNVMIVSETFFDTMHIPVLLGREFRASDAVGAPNVAIVNQAFAHKYFPDRNPIGQMIHNSGDQSDWQIVGISRDARYVDVKTPVQPTVQFPFREHPLRWEAAMILRTTQPPIAVLAAARQAIAELDPNVPLGDIQTQEQIRDQTISQQRAYAELGVGLAVLALLLSCIGLYGLMAYNVARRTGEIGIRMALGATPRQIAIPILRQALFLAGIGVTIGTPLALVLTRLIRSNLYGVEPSDPATFCLSAIVLLLVTLIAAWTPARRAAKVDPMVALRCE